MGRMGNQNPRFRGGGGGGGGALFAIGNRAHTPPKTALRRASARAPCRPCLVIGALDT